MNSKTKIWQEINVRWLWSLAAVVLALVYLAAQGGIVFAHGEVIEVNPNDAKSGDEVTITGDEFPAGEEVELLLEGVRGTVDFGHVVVDETGVFEFVATIPGGTAAGVYQLVAASEDDRVTTEFTVLAGGTGGATEGGGDTILTFERGGTETVVIGILVAIATLVGGALVYSSRHRGSGGGGSKPVESGE